MALKFQSPLLLLGLSLWILGIISCKQDDSETFSPTPSAPKDTIEIDIPEEIIDSIRYTAIDQFLNGAPATYLLLVDSASNTSLTFDLKKLSGGNVSIGVFTTNCQILDNSTFGFFDALSRCKEINASGHWSQNSGQLSTTVGNSGQFGGKTNKYLGIRFPSAQGGYHYGWVKLSINGAGDLLTISDFAFRTRSNRPIFAGQQNLIVPCVEPYGTLTLIADKSEILGDYKKEQSPNCSIQILESSDPSFDFTIQYFPFMWPYHKIPGRIVNGKLIIPQYSFSGNIPSPGGIDRPYSGIISGSGEMFLQNQTTTIVWQIEYEKTGFLSESYHGEFVMERCQ